MNKGDSIKFDQLDIHGKLQTFGDLKKEIHNFTLELAREATKQYKEAKQAFDDAL